MRTQLACLMTILTALLAGCVAAPPATPPDAPGAGVRIITEENAPLNYTSFGELRGSSSEIARTIMRRLGWHNEIEVLPWNEGYALVQGQPNVVLFSTMCTAERRDLFKWAGPVAMGGDVLIARRGEGARFRGAADQRAARGIATVEGRDGARRLRRDGFSNLVSGPDHVTALRRLMAGEVELVAVSALAWERLCAEAGIRPAEVEPAGVLSAELYYFAFARATPDSVVAAWQAELDALKRAGDLAAIFERWQPEAVPPGVMTIGVEEYPPFAIVRDGQVVGFALEMLRELQARLGANDPVRLLPVQALHALAQGHPNVVIMPVARNAAVENDYYWLGPLATGRDTLYRWHAADLAVPNIDAARRVRRVAVVAGSPGEAELRRRGFSNLQSCSSAVAAVQALMAGQAQLLLLEDLTMPEIARQARVSPEELAAVAAISATPLYLALSRGTPPATVQAWQMAYDRIRTERTLEGLRRQWLPPAAP